jgi:serine/threonine protein kinase
LLNDFYPGNQFRQYKLLEQIGVGGIGLVWSALDKTHNRIVAIKINQIDEDNQAVNYLMLDRHITGLHHPYVMPTFDFGVWKNIQYIVTPYIPGGSLEDRINDRESFPISEALQYAAEIVSALDYLHGENVIHRDLKPANILINFNRHLFVSDFDLARVLSQTTQSMHTGRGTPVYAPPEQHTKAAITLQSDIFSLGIVLYEMFTLKLPWNGEESLGIQQLSGNAELPDPRDITPSLPVDLVHVLRKMTAANPENRPASAGEAMQMVYACFGIKPIMVSTDMGQVEADFRDFDAMELLRQGQARWEKSGDSIMLNLTKFAFIDLKYRQPQENLSTNTLKFMLHNALFYGYQDVYWWGRLRELRERLSIAIQLIAKNNEVLTERVIDHLSADSEIQSVKINLPQSLLNTLLAMAFKTKNDGLLAKILGLLRTLLPSPAKWRKTAFSVDDDDRNLAMLATRDTPGGDRAALLIGHLRSESATLVVAQASSASRRIWALHTIRLAAGDLPVSIPLRLRMAVTGEWLQRLIVAKPNNLLLVFAMAFLGTTLGTSTQIYFTYRLPSFLDLERITISLERGILLGVVFGLGILVTRLIAERFTILNSLQRVLLATIVGGLGLNIGLFTYDVLFLRNTPHGILITIGCLLIALGFALGILYRKPVHRMVVSALVIIFTLAGTWWAHVNLSPNPTDLSPLFFYEYTWTNIQVLGVILVVALPMAILGNLFSLSLDEF